MFSHLGGTYMWLQGRNKDGCTQTRQLLQQVYHVRRTSGHTSRDLEAAVVTRVEP